MNISSSKISNVNKKKNNIPFKHKEDFAEYQVFVKKEYPKLTVGNLEEKISSYGRKKVAILDFIIAVQNGHKVVFPSHSTIARRVGCSEGYVDRIITELKKDNLLDTFYRHRKTSIFRINPSFFAIKLRKSLQNILPALKFIPLLILLFSKSSANFQERNARLESEHKRFMRSIQSHYAGKMGPIKSKYKYLNKLTLITHLDYKESNKSFGCYDSELKKRTAMLRESVTQCAKVINLTLMGRIKLAALEDKALNKAFEKVKNLKKPELEKFKLLYTIAFNDMKDRNIIPDWELQKAFCYQYNLSGKEPVVIQPVSLFAKKTDHSIPLSKIKYPKKGMYVVFVPGIPPLMATYDSFVAISKTEEHIKLCKVLNLPLDYNIPPDRVAFENAQEKRRRLNSKDLISKAVGKNVTK